MTYTYIDDGKIVTLDTKPDWASDHEEEVAAEEVKIKEQLIRDRRNGLLGLCDWTQNSDVPEETRTKWLTYRQALRDITKHENFPDLKEENWPTEPS